MRTRPIGSSPGSSASAVPDLPHRERARPRQTFLQVLEEGSRPVTTPSSPVAPLSRTDAPRATPNEPLRALLVRTLRAEDQLDRLIASAASGKTYSAGQLLALQATAFRYSQTVEVLSRAADRLVGSIKQTLGTQV